MIYPQQAARNHPETLRRTNNLILTLASLLAMLMASTALAWPPEAPSEVPEFSNVSVHDPSPIRVGTEFYVFGSHLASAATDDWRHWTQITTDTTVSGGNALVPDPAVEFVEAID